MLHHRVGRLPCGVCAVLLAVILSWTASTPGAHGAEGWRPTGALAGARADHTATLLSDGTVLVAGGRASEPLGAPLASAELYDPRTGTWSSAGTMGAARSGHTATLLTGPGCGANCGKVLVVGGAVTQTAAPGLEVTETAELYDPATRMWTSAAPMAAGRALHTASRLHAAACEGATAPSWCGKVLVAGGAGSGTATELATSELFDPVTGLWSSGGGALAIARREHTATVLSDGTVLAVGGRRTPPDAETDPVVGQAERFDPAAGTWTAAGSTLVPRWRHAATLMPDGRVFVTGGVNRFDQPRQSAEFFDPTAAPAGAWVAPSQMSEGRGSHTATLFPDGSVRVAGGGGPTLDRASSERYNSRPSAAWRRDASLITGRQRHTATLLTGPGCEPRCGQLLVVGGLRQGSTFLSSAELRGPLPPVPQPSAVPAARAVADLAARVLSTRRVALTFSAPSPAGDASQPAARYQVKQSRAPITATNFATARSLCGGTCTFSPSRAGETVTLTVEDLPANRRFYYALRALDSAGRPGALSNVVQARTPRDTTRPGRPRSLSARALSRGRVKLTFRAPASDGRVGPPVRRFVIKQSSRRIRSASDFRRARSLCRGSCGFGPARVGSRLTVGVRRLCAGRRYFYAIRAKDEGGNLSRVAGFRGVRARGSGGGRC